MVGRMISKEKHEGEMKESGAASGWTPPEGWGSLMLMRWTVAAAAELIELVEEVFLIFSCLELVFGVEHFHT